MVDAETIPLSRLVGIWWKFCTVQMDLIQSFEIDLIHSFKTDFIQSFDTDLIQSFELDSIQSFDTDLIQSFEIDSIQSLAKPSVQVWNLTLLCIPNHHIICVMPMSGTSHCYAYLTTIFTSCLCLASHTPVHA